MAERRVSVRLAAVGGRQVRAELEGVGEAGSRGFGRLSREMEAANARLAAFSRRVRGRRRRRRGRRCRRWRGDDPLRPADGRCAGQARAVARHHRRLDPDAGARGRTGGRVDVRHRAGDQGSDAPSQPGGRRDRPRRRRARPAGAFGQRADRPAAGPARRRDQRRHRELRARRRTRGRRGPALRRGRLHRHVADRHRDAAPGDRGRARLRCRRLRAGCRPDRADERCHLPARADLARAVEPAGRRRSPRAGSRRQRHGGGRQPHRAARHRDPRSLRQHRPPDHLCRHLRGLPRGPLGRRHGRRGALRPRPRHGAGRPARRADPHRHRGADRRRGRARLPVHPPRLRRGRLRRGDVAPEGPRGRGLGADQDGRGCGGRGRHGDVLRPEGRRRLGHAERHRERRGFRQHRREHVRGRLRGDQGDLGPAARRHRRSGVPGGQQPGRRRRGDAERRGLAHQRLHRRHQPGAGSARVRAAHLAGARPRPRRDREPLRGRGQCCHDSGAGGVRPGLRGQPAHRARSRPDRGGEPGARVREPLSRRRARSGRRGPRARSKAGRRCAMPCAAPTRPVPMR